MGVTGEVGSCGDEASRTMKMVEDKGIACTIDDEDNDKDPYRVSHCSSFDTCFNQGWADNDKCQPWESCAYFLKKRT